MKEEIKEIAEEEDESFIFNNYPRDPKKNSTIEQIQPVGHFEIDTEPTDLKIPTLDSNRKRTMS